MQDGYGAAPNNHPTSLYTPAEELCSSVNSISYLYRVKQLTIRTGKMSSPAVDVIGSHTDEFLLFLTFRP